MLGKTIISDVTEWRYEKVRLYLLLHSAGLARVIEDFRATYSLKGKTKSAVNSILDDLDFGLNKPMSNDFNKITEVFSIDSYFLQTVILNNGLTNMDKLDHYWLPIYYPPISDTGSYIKISTGTSRNTVLEAFDAIKADFRRISKDPNVSGGAIIKDSYTKPRNINLYSRIFLTIERMLYDNLKEYAEKTSYDDSIESSMKDIFTETIAKIDKKDPRTITEKDIAKIKDIYYRKVMFYYALPDRKEWSSCIKTPENEQPS